MESLREDGKPTIGAYFGQRAPHANTPDVGQKKSCSNGECSTGGQEKVLGQEKARPRPHGLEGCGYDELALGATGNLW